MRLGAEQPIQEKIAPGAIDGLGDRYVVIQYEVAFQSRLRRRRRGLPHVVGLQSSLGYDRRGVHFEGRADQKPQLASLVSAKGEAGAIVALDIELRSSQDLPQPIERFERRRRVSQPKSRELIEAHLSGFNLAGLRWAWRHRSTPREPGHAPVGRPRRTAPCGCA